MTRRCKRIPEFPLSASISFRQPGGRKKIPRTAANKPYCEITLAYRCDKMQKGLTGDGDSAEYLAALST
jgi:hypothetical protein